MADSDLLESVRRTIQHRRLFPSSGVVIIAVSGGADSLALMHMLSRLSLSVSLHVATFDHGWRGNQSAADMNFVLAQAAALGLPATARSAPPHTPHTEAAARRARYSFLSIVAGEVGASHIATAHHADDQAETVLLRLLRGTGLAGLAGMQHSTTVPDHPHLTLVRPLLSVTRAQIEAYCANNSLTPRHDPTNDDPAHLRNHVRHNILPQLADINPQIRNGLAHLAETAATDADYLQSQANALLSIHTTHTPPRWTLDRAAFRAWHPALQRRAMLTLVRRLAPESDPGYTHIIAAIDLADTGKPGAIAQFPSKVQMRVDYTTLVFERTDVPPVRPDLNLQPGTTRHINIGQPIRLGAATFTLTTSEGEGIALGHAFIPAGTHPLTLRTRQPGDRLAPPGMNGHTRKLKDWMIDRKIPAQHRDFVPLLVTDKTIIAVLHTTTGTVCHPFHLPRPATPPRLALTWNPG